MADGDSAFERSPAARGGEDGTIGKAIALLDAVAARGRPARFSELLVDSALPKATLYRLLQTLTRQRMLSYDPETGAYALGGRLLRLAQAAVEQSTLAPTARPHLDALSAATGETIHLAKLDNGQVLYLDKRNAARRIPMFSETGKVGPAYCTGVGKAMLAFLDSAARADALAQQSWRVHTKSTLKNAEALEAELADIRAEGVAFDREEHEPGIVCVAAPILDSQGRPLGAVSITASTGRRDLADLATEAPRLREAAAAIARDAEAQAAPRQKGARG